MRDVALLALAAVAFLAFYAVYAPQTTFNPDSASYLNFSAQRSGGYPFFLSVLDSLNVRGDNGLVAQRGLYALCVFILGIELLCFLGRSVPALLCALALLGNPEVNRYHFVILTESLFLSASALFLAAALAYLRAGRSLPLAAAAVLTGALIAIRPSGLAFVPVLLALAFVPDVRPAFGRLLMLAILPLLAIIALEWGYYRVHHGAAHESLAPMHLLAKAGLAEAPGAAASAVSGAAKPLADALETSLAPVRRLIAEAPNEPARCLLLANYEGFVQYGFAPDERRRAAAAEGDRALIHVALARLAQGAGSYLARSLDHFYCMWTLGAMTASERAAMDAYIAAHRPLPFEDKVAPGLAGTRLPPAALVVRWGMLGAAALLAFTMLALLGGLLRLYPLPRILAAAGLCGMAVHATLALTALAGIGIPRYLLGVWVPLALGVVLAVTWAWDVIRRRGVRSHGPADKTAAA